MLVDYGRALKDNKFDLRIPLMHQHKCEVNNLIRTGYYYKVKNFIDRYEKNGEYLINVEIFPKLVVLQYVSSVDNFKTILQDKILI